MPIDPVSQLNLSKYQADFTYPMDVKAIKIQDTGKGAKSMAEDLQAVLREIEGWHQGSITGFRDHVSRVQTDAGTEFDGTASTRRSLRSGKERKCRREKALASQSI